MSIEDGPGTGGSSIAGMSTDKTISLAQVKVTALDNVTEPLPIVFNDVSLNIKGKPILTQVCGRAREGELTALMVSR